MKAIVQDRYGSPDVLELRDVDKPAVGEDDDVLVRVHAAGVDQGVWHLMSGLPYLVRLFGYGVRAPKAQYRIRGTDVAGHVEAVGRRVTRFQPGDEVFGACDGAFAEYVRAPQDQLAIKPATVSFEQAAAVATGGVTALQGLRDQGGIQAGQKVAILGASGGVGSLAVQLAKRTFDAHVTGVCSPAKTDLVRSLGADDVIDYTREDLADGTRHFDLILDTAGNRPLSQLRRALTPTGTLVIVGGEGKGRWLGGTDRQLRAVALSPFVNQRLRMLFSVPRAEDLELLRRAMEAGDLVPVVDRTYPLVETPDAISYLHQGHARGRAVVIV